MALWELTIRVEIDDEALRAHNDDEAPPSNNVKEWYSSDVLLAHQKGILEFEHEEIEFAQRVHDA